jgi:hypothetical protein
MKSKTILKPPDLVLFALLIFCYNSVNRLRPKLLFTLDLLCLSRFLFFWRGNVYLMNVLPLLFLSLRWRKIFFKIKHILESHPYLILLTSC